MPKPQTIFECTNCGAQYPKWEGRCRSCGKWGTLSELRITNYELRKDEMKKTAPAEIVDFAHIDAGKYPRILTGIGEFDHVLGGGIMPGSLILIGGAPGIGKSTLLLQICGKLTNGTVLYISGEESASQVKSRLDRLELQGEHIKFSAEIITEKICAAIKELKPKLAIIDSIQTLKSLEINSTSGSLNQVTASTVKLMEIAKSLSIPIIIIGHITKEGVVAGPKTLEHLVDTVLYFEGDKNHGFRLLRAIKNRFGGIDEVGIFEMTERGLQEVTNPSTAFLQDFDETIPGTVTTVIMEGTRPLLVEIQALSSKTYFGYPKRATSGFKKSRLEVLIAILTKRKGLRLGEYDVYLNVAGGLKISEPAADLAAALAILSSFEDRPMTAKTCVFGELGLGGEVRQVPFFEKRLHEIERLGFTNIICPVVHGKNLKTKVQYKEVKNIKEMMI